MSTSWVHQEKVGTDTIKEGTYWARKWFNILLLSMIPQQRGFSVSEQPGEYIPRDILYQIPMS